MGSVSCCINKTKLWDNELLQKQVKHVCKLRIIVRHLLNLLLEKNWLKCNWKIIFKKIQDIFRISKNTYNMQLLVIKGKLNYNIIISNYAEKVINYTHFYYTIPFLNRIIELC